jgi:energy-coupling factor transporter ATP-binding protein EcfA2
MRVAKLELTGVGPFEGAVFEMPEPPEGKRGELVFFEGPNGCGKTTIAQAIACAAALPVPFNMGQLLSGGYAPVMGHQSGPHPPLREVIERFRRGADAVLTASLEARAQLGRVQIERTQVRMLDTLPPRNQTEASRLVEESLQESLPNHRGTALSWAAFAYRGHQSTAAVDTKGPTPIVHAPLHGALAFGAVMPASAHFGQLLVNLDQEVAKAFREAHRSNLSAERREEMDRLAATRQKTLDEIARALSEVVRRKVTFDVPVGEHMPTIFVDGEAIPLPLLGEGMRSTFAWLSDLLVRLHRLSWADTTRSPLEQDFWLILDEIDESLHPTMQAHIYPALRALFPNARIYATTHSPFVIASAAEGVVFAIRPGKDHKVRGQVKPRPLQPGESLELVTDDVFGAPSGFVDQQTRDDIRAHDRDTQTLRKKQEIDWSTFMTRRDRLMALNDEVRTLVAMQEVPVKQEVLRRMRERIAENEREART